MSEQIQITRPNLTNSEVELIKSGLMMLDSRTLGFDEDVKNIFRKLKPRGRTPKKYVQGPVLGSRGPV